MFSAKIEIDTAKNRMEVVELLRDIATEIEDGADSFSPHKDGYIVGDVVVRNNPRITIERMMD